MSQTDTWADITLYPYRFSSMGVSGGWTGTMGDIQISDKRVVMSQPGYDYGRSKGEGLGTESEIIWGWMRSSLPPQDKQLNTKWEITLEMSEGTRWLLDLERCPCWVYRRYSSSVFRSGPGVATTGGTPDMLGHQEECFTRLKQLKHLKHLRQLKHQYVCCGAHWSWSGIKKHHPFLDLH